MRNISNGQEMYKTYFTLNQNVMVIVIVICTLLVLCQDYSIQRCKNAHDKGVKNVYTIYLAYSI
jgi:hypothetical protein